MVKQIMIVVMLVMALLLSGCGQRNEEEEVTTSTYSQVDQETSDIFTEEPATDSNETEEMVAESSEIEESTESSEITESIEEEVVMRLFIGKTEVPVTWEDNGAAADLKAILPLTVQMSMYGGFEQVGPIGQSISSQDVRTTTEAGDIVLYSSNQIVIFYGSNTWAYTRLGHIELDQSEMEDLLGNGDVEITITAD